MESSNKISKDVNLLREEFLMHNIYDFDLSEPLAKALMSYAVQTKNSINAQSQIVEEALIEFFERRRVKIEA